MGLQITKSNNRFGIDVEYWKIGPVKINWHASTCMAELMGFVNKAQRDSGKEPPVTERFTFNGASFSFTHTAGLITQIYTKIKACEGWTSSVDC
jgi:hypothetical protein